MWCKASGFPAIGIVAPINYRGGALQMVLVALLQGKFSQDDLMVTMIKMTQAFEPVLAATLRDSVARDLERDLRLEQEEEFELALAADRERQQLAEEQAREFERQAHKHIQEQNRRAALREVVLAPEPGPGPGIAKIQFRFPTGQQTVRRFNYHDKIELLQSFVHSKGITDEFALIRSFPPRQLDDLEETVEQAGLVPSAQVLVAVESVSDDEGD
eukprot:TRINITY_DN2611_c0_g1_i5.p1 TRINITY_DN2611_c0_g1~~TRINITY_DN2611_c0_g1_i5.p1  ORF type:complete len:215 (-),score=42.43 TRINITY_DN2611_c0_g1_i5:387-1031(-)